MSDIKNIINPFDDAGTVHATGLDNMIAGIDTTPTAEEIMARVQYYFYYTYFSSRETESIPRETIGVITSRAINQANDYKGFVAGLEVADEVKVYLNKIWDYVDKFHKYAYNSDNNNIFTSDYSSEFRGVLNDLANEVWNSSLQKDQKILPQVAIAVLRDSYTYWYNVYNDTGGDYSTWYDWIVTTVEGVQVSDLDWKNILKSDLAGAVIGAVEAFTNKDDFQSIVIGAAAGSIAASTKELSMQMFNKLQSNRGELFGGEVVSASASPYTNVTKRVVNVTVCASGHGIRLPHAKAGNVIFIKNTGAYSCSVWAANGEYINVSSAAISISANNRNTFNCAIDGDWIT